MVDDNENLVAMIKEYFATHLSIDIALEAYDGASNGGNGKHKDDFDVLILDLIMPNKDGLYVLDEMKKRNINKSI